MDMMGHDGGDGARFFGFSGVSWPFRPPGTPESVGEGMEEETQPILSSNAALATLFVPIFRFCDSGLSTFLEPQKLRNATGISRFARVVIRHHFIVKT